MLFFAVQPSNRAVGWCRGGVRSASTSARRPGSTADRRVPLTTGRLLTCTLHLTGAKSPRRHLTDLTINVCYFFFSIVTSTESKHAGKHELSRTRHTHPFNTTQHRLQYCSITGRRRLQALLLICWQVAAKIFGFRRNQALALAALPSSFMPTSHNGKLPTLLC